MFRAFFFFCCLALPAGAEAIRVTSGEHDSFSRLVLSAPQALDWAFGRTADGYELTLNNGEYSFDVSRVFDLIPRTRLTGIFADPANGHLQLAVGCACHAVPFRLDARTIVIDLRDGAAPAGSSFEVGLDGAAWPALQGRSQAAIRPRSRQTVQSQTETYNWLKAELPPTFRPIELSLPATEDASLSVRESLIARLADAATRNVVDLAIPEDVRPTDDSPFLPESLPLRISDSVGLRIGNDASEPPAMQPDGSACLSDEELNLASWVTEEDKSAPYSGLSLSVIGEFDRANPDEVSAAAKRYLYLGFGAETRALLDAFPTEGHDTQFLNSLSFLIDGERLATPNAFTGMENCDTTAAFWAYLAGTDAPKGTFNKAGLLRGFSALPAHLKSNLGPQFVAMLLQNAETDLAIQVRELMDRGQLDDHRALSLVSAELMLAESDPVSAIGHAEQVLADPGDMEVDAIMTLVAAQIAAGVPVETETVTSLQGLLTEYTGNERYAELAETYILALASAGQYSAARSFADDGHHLRPEFWSMLADFGSDDDLLVQVMMPGTHGVPSDAMVKIADRLAALGFPDHAATWNGQAGSAALTVEGQIEPTAAMATAAATVQNDVNSQQVPAENDDDVTQGLTTEARDASWAADWPSVAELDEGTWGQLSQNLADETGLDQGVSLELVTESLQSSVDTRELIAELLADTTLTAADP